MAECQGLFDGNLWDSLSQVKSEVPAFDDSNFSKVPPFTTKAALTKSKEYSSLVSLSLEQSGDDIIMSSSNNEISSDLLFIVQSNEAVVP